MPAEKACPLCGHVDEQMEIGSTSTFGAPDLDLRPAELMRSSLPFWVVRCGRCGYVRWAGDSEPIPDHAAAQRLVSSQEYQGQLHCSDFPDLANDFLCLAQIAEKANSPGEAGWSALRAAWACDDEGLEHAASACRSRAYGLFEMALAAGQEIVEEGGGHWVVLVDVLRRAGRFEEGRELGARARQVSLDDFLARLVDFELELIDQGDRSAHAVDEVDLAEDAL